MSNQSEIARLMEQVTVKHRAMLWVLTGLSKVSVQHADISRRMKHREPGEDLLYLLTSSRKNIFVWVHEALWRNIL